MKLDEKDLIYLAGFFDGEGNVCIAKHFRGELDRQKNPSYKLQIVIGSTDRSVLLEFHEKTQLGNICIQRPSYKNAKALYRWQMGSRNAKEFLEALLPYLRIKRQQAELAIAFQNYQDSKYKVFGEECSTEDIQLKEAIKKTISELNQRGDRIDTLVETNKEVN